MTEGRAEVVWGQGRDWEGWEDGWQRTGGNVFKRMKVFIIFWGGQRCSLFWLWWRYADIRNGPTVTLNRSVYYTLVIPQWRLPWWLSSKESACQGRRRRFDPWVGKIPWRRKWQPTPGFLPGKPIDRWAWPCWHKRVRHDLAAKQQQYISGGKNTCLFLLLGVNCQKEKRKEREFNG